MSLSGMMTAVAEYVGDRLVNECGRPIPDRVLRYHGTLPADCCTVDGSLAVSQASGIASSSFPTSAVNASSVPCVLWPTYTLSIQYRVCAPVPEVDSEGVEVSPLLDARYDTYAAMLADVTDCIMRELVALQCEMGTARAANTLLDDYEQAVFDNLARPGFLRFVDATPSVPSGGCAGVVWRIIVAPNGLPVS